MEYTREDAINETKEYRKKILHSKKFKRRYHRVLKQIQKAAANGKSEYWWVPTFKDTITQLIYDELSNNDFIVWTNKNGVGYTIQW